jgi:tryptophan synthase alpha subunit
MKIKVCGMRDGRNIAEIALLTPDFMGFIFYEPSPRNACAMPPEALDALPPETKRVGVFVDASPEYILETARRYALDLVQLHGSESPETCAELRRTLGVIKAFGIRTAADVERAAAWDGTCDYYIFDTAGAGRGGTGRKFDHRLLASYHGMTPYLLSGGLGPDDAMALVETARKDPCCRGVDINSRFETTPGVKDPDAIAKFMATITTLTTMNRIDKLFKEKNHGILSVYFTAGYPALEDTAPTIQALVRGGVDMIEIGIPFSDPMADGPVIQHSGSVALTNGMTLKKLFAQLEGIRSEVDVPLVAMGYLNPVMQYGIEEFCRDCARVGIDGIIIPDLPFADYIRDFKPLIERYGLHFITLITPETSDERIRLIDANTSGFIYMVSTASTTGARDVFDERTLDYFRRVDSMGLRNPRMIGFGISNRATFAAAASHAAGGIIGSAFIRLVEEAHSIGDAVEKLVAKIR